MDAKGILPEFQEFLVSNQLAAEKHIPFLAIWAGKFLAFSNRQRQQDISVTVAEFLDSMRVTEKVVDWQVRQAEEAVRLYLNHFKGGEELKALSGQERTEGRLSDAPSLLAEMKRLIRVKHLAYKTELAYIDWAKQFIGFVGKTSKDNPSTVLTPAHVQNFLSHLAITKRVSSSTQNQALCAVVFLFRDVLGQDIGDISGMVWAKRGKKLPVVLWADEVKALFKYLTGTSLLMAHLLYGSGLRINELCRLRVLDIDFEGKLLAVRNAKGDKDRSTILSEAVKEPLGLHLPKVKALHDRDLAAGHGEVYLPGALARKYPNAAWEWKWQYVFPSAKLSVDPRSGKVRRHHVSDKGYRNINRGRGQEGRHYEACNRPYAAPQLCYPSASVRGQYPRSTGTPRSQERRDYYDLYPCSQKYVECVEEPAGYALFNKGTTVESKSKGHFTRGKKRPPFRYDTGRATSGA